MESKTFVYAPIDKVRTAVLKMHGRDGSRRSNYYADFNGTPGITPRIHLMGQLCRPAGTHFILTQRETATHVRFDAWVIANIHSFGYGARGKHPWQFSERFFKQLGFKVVQGQIGSGAEVRMRVVEPGEEENKPDFYQNIREGEGIPKNMDLDGSEVTA